MKLTIEQVLKKGVAAHKEGQFKDAESLYRTILQSAPAHPDANHNLGVLAISVNQFELALPLFKTALEVNPMVEQFWVSYVDALVRVKNVRGAKQAVKKAKKKGINAAKLERLLSQTEGSLDTKEPSLARLNILLECYQSGGLSKAEKLAIAMTREFPKHQFAWKVLGVIYGQTDRKAEAVNANQTAVALSPQDSEAHSNLGNTLRELGRLDEAEASCRQAITLKPDFAEAYSNLGLTLQELGRSYEAEASYTKAIALKPDYAEAHHNLGITFEELGRLDDAEASYTRAIALEPCFAEALSNRGYLLFGKGRFEAALSDADACRLDKKTRALPFISLYALGQVDEIFRRLEIASKDDGENMSIAAFAAFFSEVQSKPTAYNFCPNPIDFISVCNLSSHLNDSAAYVAGIIEELNKIEAMWEPFQKSTVGGFQSLQGVNLFKAPSEKIDQLKLIIINEVEKYLLKFENKNCSYIENFPSGNNLFGWKVILKSQGHQRTHIHPGGWLSGVVYLKVVPSLGKNEGAIEFNLNSDYYYDDNSLSFTFQPEVGDIVFFPSSLHHRTLPFTTDGERIIISFDLMPDSVKH